jgi:prepilin-type N-terminal cleavage/methylation domain-containing protein
MKKGNHSGFTLIELMTTLLVAGVVLSIGIPAFNEFVATNQKTPIRLSGDIVSRAVMQKSCNVRGHLIHGLLA